MRKMGHFNDVLTLTAFMFLISRRTHASSVNSWLWTQDSYLNDIQLDSYFLSEDIFSGVNECAMECMQIPTCLSFFVMDLSAYEKHCKFHAKIFSTYEVENFGFSVPGSRNFKISSDCPESVQYYFSKSAKMCIRVHIGTSVPVATAVTTCNGNGDSLAVIDSFAKQQFVKSVLLGTSGFTTRTYHVGAASVGQGKYQWSNGVTLASGFLHSTDPLVDDCITVKMNSTNEIQGHSVDCAAKHNLICERVLA